MRLEMPLHMQSALIFHYNLKFYNKDADNFEGVSLKRFVMQVKLCRYSPVILTNHSALSLWLVTLWPSVFTLLALPSSYSISLPTQ